MAAIISRRLRLTTSSLLLRPSHSPSSSPTNLLLFNNNPQPPIFEPFSSSFTASSHFFSQSITTLPKSTTSHGPFSKNPFVQVGTPSRFLSSSSSGSQRDQNGWPFMKRDHSALANGTREAVKGAMNTFRGLSNAMAIAGLLQFGLLGWVYHITQSSSISELSVQSICALLFASSFSIALPFYVAHELRHSVKPVHHLKKMEKQGRLQILTLPHQLANKLDLLFCGVRGSSLVCLAGVSAGIIVFTVLNLDKSVNAANNKGADDGLFGNHENPPDESMGVDQSRFGDDQSS